MSIMRLTKNNILFVKRYTCFSVTYEWFVGMKSRRVCDSRCFSTTDGKKTIIEEYPVTELPKSVQDFINEHEEVLLNNPEDKFKIYMIG